MENPKSIFISYSQDSDAHSQKVLALVEELEAAGFRCAVDQTVGSEAVAEGLSNWMHRSILSADYILVICSERYYKIVHNNIELDVEVPGRFESVLSYGDIYQSVVLSRKLIPVILDAYFRKSVPEPLADRRAFLLNDEYPDLLAALQQGNDFSLPEVVPVLAAPEVAVVAEDRPHAQGDTSVTDVSMQDLMARADLTVLHPNTLVAGVINEITDQEITVDVGAKAEGVIARSECADPESFTVGESIEVYVEKVEGADGRPVVSCEKARQIRAWDELSQQGEVGSVVKGRVMSATQRGLVVNIGIDCFLPASQIDVRYVANLDSYVGQTLDLVILKIDIDSRHVVVSRRALLEEQRQQRQREFFDNQKVGDVLMGRVSAMLDFGVFVDLGGIDGLVPISELSFTRVEHPSEVVALGESVRVNIKSIDEARLRIGLSMKDAMANPWADIESRYGVGSQVHGTVVSMVTFGAFVEIEPGVQGLIHLSEFSWKKRVSKPEEMLKLGEAVAVVVVQVDAEAQKMGLSLKQMDVNPWALVERNYTVGHQVTGTVTKLADFGVFVGLDEGVEGLVHISDMSWKKRPRHPSEMVKVGDKLTAVLLGIDAEAQRISLGMKQALDDPWEGIENIYKLGSIITGNVTRMASFGAFVEISSQIEGLVHISEIQEDHVNRVEDVLKVGQKVQARVVNIDTQERRIGLSIKAAQLEDLQADVQASQSKMSGGGSLNSLADIFDQLTKNT